MQLSRFNRMGSSAFAFAFAVSLAACGGNAEQSPPAKSPAPLKHETSQTQIISNKTDGTPDELMARGERALMAQKWQEAVDAFSALYDLGFAYEGLNDSDTARTKYRELRARFPNDANTRLALQREATIDAYAEDFVALGEVGAALMQRKDIDDIDRMTGLGARGLAKVEAGDDVAASKDVQDGLDLVESLHYGAENRLPVPAAQLRFGLAEIRRVRSEKLKLTPITPDFVMKLEVRCTGLLEAQNAYTDAIRSIDPHWAAMSGFRVGEMYRTLHRELMSIPPNELAKTDKDKQLFYAIMHVRYRALIEKGLEMMNRTLALADKTQDASTWVMRTKEAKKEMESALVEEKAQLATFPFTEQEVEGAIELMKKHSLKKQADDEKRANSKK